MTDGKLKRSASLCAVLAIAPLAGACIPPGANTPPRYYPVVHPKPVPKPGAAQPNGQAAAADTQNGRRGAPVSVLPAPPPAWEAAPVTADGQLVTATTYVVKPGDSLRSIAEKTGAGSEAIARANNIAPPYIIHSGQRLAIPGGRYHLVRSGQTGIAIARAYGVAWSRVVAENNLVEPYILRTGMRLLIPGDTRAMTIEERAANFRLNIDDIMTGGQPAIAARDKPRAPSPSSARVLPPSAAVAPPAALTGSFAWPARGQILHKFGPIASGGRMDGIKIGLPYDTPILATADGTVAYVGTGIPALGGLVILQHDSTWTSVYGHAGQLLVQRGQSVKKGQMIALSGDSGTDRPQLHFELRQGRTPVDPLLRLPPR